MKTAAIIQARMSSTRLPSKALLEICGKPMLFHVIEQAKLIKSVDMVILATGKGRENHPLLEIAENCGISSYSGSEDDVLERFYDASERICADYIIRITGDNPLTDHISASYALEHALQNEADHCTTSGIPVGTGVEIIKKEALVQAFREGKEPHHREHVTPYIKEHPEKFKIVQYISALKNPFPQLRLTVDTVEDFTLIDIIFKNLYTGTPLKLEDIIDLLESDRELIKINAGIEQRPMTHHSHG